MKKQKQRPRIRFEKPKVSVVYEDVIARIPNPFGGRTFQLVLDRYGMIDWQRTNRADQPLEVYQKLFNAADAVRKNRMSSTWGMIFPVLVTFATGFGAAYIFPGGV